MTNFSDQLFQIPITKINYLNTGLSFGSCFAENIANKLKGDFFNISSNPYGITFHPLAIASVFNRIIDLNLYQKSDFFHFDNYWWNYEHHGSIAKTDLDSYINQSNKLLNDYHEFFINANYLILTFGTAIGYSYKDFIVSNCHKQSQDFFIKKLSLTDEIFSNWNVVFSKLFKMNPNLEVLISVSPVRYLREGLANNGISKAHLRVASQMLANKFINVFYLPVYELVIDEWRDYACFGNDKVHLTENYLSKIYNKFIFNLTDDSTLKMIKSWNSIKTKLNHKPLHNQSYTYAKFIDKLEVEIKEFETKYNLQIST